MRFDGPRLQSIDALLRQEPVDHLREVLKNSEIELEKKRRAVLTLLGDSYTDVLKCASAISVIYQHSDNLFAVTKNLKSAQSKLQDVLLSAHPPEQPFCWTKRTIDNNKHKKSTPLAKWLGIKEDLWQFVVTHQTTDTTTTAQYHLLIRSYSELPRLILSHLSLWRPLQAIVLLCEWGAKLQETLKNKVSKQNPIDQQYTNALLYRQSIYFSCHNFLSKANQTALQVFNQPWPSPYLNSTPHHDLLLPRCLCRHCQPYIKRYTCAGSPALFEALLSSLLSSPHLSIDDLLKQLYTSRSDLLTTTLLLLSEASSSCCCPHDESIESASAADDSGGCELANFCFSNLGQFVQQLELNEIRSYGYQISYLIRLFETTIQTLCLFETDCCGPALQDIIGRLFGTFSEPAANFTECDCDFCKNGTKPIVHLWKNASQLPRISDDLSQKLQSSSQKLSEKFTNDLKSKLLHFIANALKKVCATAGGSSVVVNCVWRLILSIIISERHYWKSRILLHEDLLTSSLMMVGMRYANVTDMLEDPLIFKTLALKSENIKATLKFPFDHFFCCRDDADILDAIALLMDSTFNSLLFKDVSKDIEALLTNKCLLKGSQSDKSSSDNVHIESLTALDCSIFRAIVTSEFIMADPCSWQVFLKETPYQNSSAAAAFKRSFAQRSPSDVMTLWKSEEIRKVLLHRMNQTPKCCIIATAMIEGIFNAINEWSVVAKSKEKGMDVDHWGIASSILLYLEETLARAKRTDISKGEERSRIFPYSMWLFRVISIPTPDEPEVPNPLNSLNLKEAATSVLQLWILSKLKFPFLEFLKSVSFSRNDSSATQWWKEQQSLNETSSWKAPSMIRPTLFAILFESCVTISLLEKQLKAQGYSNPDGVWRSTNTSIQQIIKQAVLLVILHLYHKVAAKLIENNTFSFNWTVQTLYDLECISLLSLHDRNHLAFKPCFPSYLSELEMSEREASLTASEIQQHIREKCFTESVDKLLYSSKNLQPLVIKFLEDKLVLISSFLEGSQGTLGKVISDWHRDKILTETFNVGSQVARVAPRIALLPVSVTREVDNLRSPERMRQFGQTFGVPDSTIRTSDPKSSTAVALRELKDGGSGGAANVAADLGSTAYRNVSSLSSFLRGHVEGLSSKVSEAIKNRQAPSSNLL